MSASSLLHWLACFAASAWAFDKLAVACKNTTTSTIECADSALEDGNLLLRKKRACFYGVDLLNTPQIESKQP
jgi:hypothetical protein